MAWYLVKLRDKFTLPYFILHGTSVPTGIEVLVSDLCLYNHGN